MHDGNTGKGGYGRNPAGLVRVLVTHSDGSREEVEIEDDMVHSANLITPATRRLTCVCCTRALRQGLGEDDLEAIRDRLAEQGISDIYDISLE